MATSIELQDLKKLTDEQFTELLNFARELLAEEQAVNNDWILYADETADRHASRTQSYGC